MNTSAMKATVASCVHEYHIYQDIWTAVIGEVLICRKEEDNRHDRYVVAVYKSPEVVEHMPGTISHTCSSRGNNEVHCDKKSALFKRFGTRRDGDSLQVHFQRSA